MFTNKRATNSIKSIPIKVNPLSDNPTKLWEKLFVNQKAIQKELNLTEFTAVKPKSKGYTRFVLISDTHNQTNQLDLPEGDFLIHAGDFSNVGKIEEINHLIEFIEQQKEKFKHIIVISGNHELTFDPNSSYGKDLYKSKQKIDSAEIKKKFTNCIYIEDETVQLNGFKIYGSPW